MRVKFASISDKLVGMVVPRVKAEAVTCEVVRSFCQGCSFWWQRRVHHVVCTNGDSWNESECCGCGC